MSLRPKKQKSASTNSKGNRAPKSAPKTVHYPVNIAELGGITTGDIYVLEQEETDLFAIYGENINTGSIKEFGEYASLDEAMIAWRKLSISFNKKELNALKKKRRTASKRMQSRSKSTRRKNKTRYQDLTKDIQSTIDALKRLGVEA